MKSLTTEDSPDSPAVVRFESGPGGDFVAIQRLDLRPSGTPDEGDVLVGVSVRYDGFTGANDIWILAAEWQAFVNDLRALEVSRRSRATITSMSPDELELTIAIVDSAGHPAVRGFLGRYYVGYGSPNAVSRVVFDVEFDPSRLRESVDTLAAMS